ncbi:MAG: hypothetical protein WCH34_10870 [Bacteroidota bacterium]
MALKYYFPPDLEGRKTWAGKYKTNIGTEGAGLGMSPADITKEQDACTSMITAIDELEAAKAVVKQKKKDKDADIKAAMDILRPNIKAHKVASGYNEGIGELLGVIGSDTEIDPSTVKTIVKTKKVPQGIDLKFSLKGCEGGNVYSKRGTETGFTLLKYIIHPHSIDTRPNLDEAVVEQRQYYVILVIDDEEVGIPSDIATIDN